MGIGAAIGGIASGLLGASSAKKAASAQQSSAQAQIDLQREIYNKTSQKFQPYQQAGQNALAAYMYDMGLSDEAPVFGAKAPQIRTITTPASGTGGTTWQDFFQGNLDGEIPALADRTAGSTTYKVGGRSFDTMEAARQYANSHKTGGTTYGGYTASPEYQWQLSEGLGAVNALAGARGGLNSGATLQALQERGQGLAAQDRSNYMNRLAGMVDMGMGAAGNQANIGNAYATGASNALANKGEAQSAGYMGVNNAIQGGINTGLNLFGYMKGLNSTGGGK